MKTFWQATAYVVAAVLGYAGWFALEMYWNFPDWAFRVDGIALLVALLPLAGLAWQAYLRAYRGSSTLLVIAGLVAAAQIALGIYLISPEPLSPGIFGRAQASPTAYRVGRALLLSLPAMWLAFGALRQTRRKGGGFPVDSGKS